MDYVERTFDVVDYGLDSPYRSRDLAVRVFFTDIAQRGMTFVGGTLRFGQRRDHRGRFLQGWRVIGRVIEHGQEYGLGVERFFPKRGDGRDLRYWTIREYPYA